MSGAKTTTNGVSCHLERAIFDDCRTLIENFVKHGDPHFAPFCTEWKSMQFNQIFHPQSSTIMLLQTMAAALHLPKRYMCMRLRSGLLHSANGTALIRRIGGLYLMYALYFKQPTQQHVKIEVSLETWREMRNFIDGLPLEPELDDARYCFWKLVQSHAFRFTALDYSASSEGLVDYDSIYDNTRTGTFIEELEDSDLNELGKIYGTTQALTVLEDGYNEMKEMLGGNCGVGAKALPSTTIIKELNDVFTNIQSILLGASEGKMATNTSKENRKTELKRKGAGLSSLATTEAAYCNNPDDDDTPGTSKQCIKKMSLRTIFAENLPQHLLDDLEAGSEREENEEHTDKEKTIDKSNESDGINEYDNNVMTKQSLPQMPD